MFLGVCRRRWVYLLSMVALLGAVVPGAGTAARRAASHASAAATGYIVVYRTGVDPRGKTDRLERGLGFSSSFRYGHALKGFAAKLSPRQVDRLSADPDVAFLSLDGEVHVTAQVPLAPGESSPTGARRIDAATTSEARESSDVAVAVIDTGIDLNNPTELNVRSGTNCVNSGAAAQDDHGHGTHVAGTIAAKNTGTGVVGVAPGTQLYAVKVLNSSGSGSFSQLICGIDWVAANAAALKIKAANMSLGGSGSNDSNCGNTNSDALHRAICASTRAGVTYVVAAGNSGANFARTVPAAYPEALTVTAVADSDGAPGGIGGAPSCRTGEADDRVASFSSFAVAGTEITHTIAAPGVCIRSTWLNGGYNTISGTSMATPHAAGSVALCFGDGGVPGPCAGLAPAQVVQKVREDAAAYSNANPGYGFDGDPNRPVTDRHYGYLVRPVGAARGPTIITTSLADATVGHAYAQTLRATGGTAPYSWSITAGSLPSGLSLAATSGEISGTPNTIGSFTFTAQVTDSANPSQSSARSLSIVVGTPVAIATTSLPDGTTGLLYSQALQATGGTTPYAWRISSGALPPGLSLNSATGTIAGTPTASGTYAFTVQVADSASPARTASQPLTLIVLSGPLAITTTSLPGGAVGRSYSATLLAAGGTTPYSWSVASGALPAGLALDPSTGTIAGIPTEAGTYAFTAQVTDSAFPADTATRSLTIVVGPALSITTTSLPDGRVATSYSATLQATGGTTPYRWTVASGALPPGLSLNASTGTIAGTPTTSGTYSFTAQVTDSASPAGTATRALSIRITSLIPMVSVDSITYAVGGALNQDLLVTVTLVDEIGGPVAAASVLAVIYRNAFFHSLPSGTTGTDGKVTFTILNALSGCYSTTIASVSASGLVWDGVTPPNTFCK